MAETFSFTDMAAEMASGWGKNAESMQEAIRSLPPTDIGGAALLYLVAAIERLRPKSNHNEAKKPTRYEGSAKKFTGIKIGDFLYNVDTDEEIIVYRKVVVGLCENDECLVVDADVSPDKTYFPSVPIFANDDDYLTPEEALQATAKNEIDYHEPKCDEAKSVLKKLELGNDISGHFAWIEPE